MLKIKKGLEEEKDEDEWEENGEERANALDMRKD